MDWQRLSKYVKERRIELGMSKREAVRRAQVGDRTWMAVENDGKPVEDHTWAGIARALEWTPASISLVLEGGEPQLLTESDTVQHQIDELTRRVERLEAKAD